MKIVRLLVAVLLLSSACSSKQQPQQQSQLQSQNRPVVLAYVTSWSDVMPDPDYVTHINYAFGHVNNEFNGVDISNEERLKSIVDLKRQKPELTVMLSIGGWTSGHFSEMAAGETNRLAFAADCQRVVEEFGLDGIDMDWEYPTSSAARISSSPDDTKNFTLLMRDIRQAIGNDKLLTFASEAGANYVDFKAVDQYVDFVNIMTYDMDSPPYHHAGLYRSESTKYLSVEEAVDAHIRAGIPAHKLTLGMPFYGRGQILGESNYTIYRDIIKLTGYTANWDSIAQAPYLTDAGGKFVCTYETGQSIAIKCEYLKEKGMLGAMYWEYSCDDEEGTLRKAVYEGVTGK
jgi:chitinase